MGHRPERVIVFATAPPRGSPLASSLLMLIQVHGDNRIPADETLRDEVSELVKRALEHLSDRVSRVEVHLGDESGNRQTKDDKRCMMEARIEGRHPTAVTHHAASVAEAIDGAAEKLRHALESAIGKADDQRNSRETVRSRP